MGKDLLESQNVWCMYMVHVFGLCFRPDFFYLSLGSVTFSAVDWGTSSRENDSYGSGKSIRTTLLLYHFVYRALQISFSDQQLLWVSPTDTSLKHNKGL